MCEMCNRQRLLPCLSFGNYQVCLKHQAEPISYRFASVHLGRKRTLSEYLDMGERPPRCTIAQQALERCHVLLGSDLC